jgi:hypothetical protein
MDQSPSSEANSHSANQIPRLLWSPKLHLCPQELATGSYPELGRPKMVRYGAELTHRIQLTP